MFPENLNLERLELHQLREWAGFMHKALYTYIDPLQGADSEFSEHPGVDQIESPLVAGAVTFWAPYYTQLATAITKLTGQDFSKLDAKETLNLDALIGAARDMGQFSQGQQ